MASPRANIGLRTGLSFDVIDLDNEAAVDALEQARGGREPLQGASTSEAEVEGAEVDIATHAGDSITGDLMTNLPRSGPEEDADRHRRRARPVGVDGVAGVRSSPATASRRSASTSLGTAILKR